MTNETGKAFAEAVAKSADKNEIIMVKSKFEFGKVVATPGVMDNISQEDLNTVMIQYVQGDWGILCDEDKALNDEALIIGNRLVAKYTASNGVDFYIITEWDRSVTTFLLPSEY
jgi:hypothetical protein